MRIGKDFLRIVSLTLVFLMFAWVFVPTASAAEKTVNLDGKYYEFTEKENYPVTRAFNDKKFLYLGDNALGKISVKGNFADQGNDVYYVQSGNLDVSYKVDIRALESAEDKWHLVTDKTNTVDGAKLDDDIRKGAIIIESSLDGTNWLVDKVYPDAFSGKEELPSTVFTTKDLHQLNGCFYRVIVAYKLERKVDSSKVLFIEKDNYEYKRAAEVYTFFVVDQHTVDSGIKTPDLKPRKEFSKVINTGKDNGYDVSQAEEMDRDDPHFGRKIGHFTVNGYTRETTEKDGSIVFLKTVGDEVTLWFTLEEDIDCLFGNEKLSIAENKKGYDKAMGVDPTNFKRGALIVKYTDEEGRSHDTAKYFDFLAANTMTGADTRITIYEEGDYEVALDYKIQDAKGIDSYSDYKITFKFAIRNGNTMAFPRDCVTGSELKDGALTANGFVIDLAASKYLTTNVVRKEVNQNADGTISAVVRENSASRNGAEYTKQGIYEITVKNEYSETEPTTVTIYVGTDKNIAALAQNHLTVEQLNELLKTGKKVGNDGSLISSSAKGANDSASETYGREAAEPAETAPVSAQENTPDRAVPAGTADNSGGKPGAGLQVPEEKEQGISLTAPLTIAAVAIAGAVVFMLKKKRNGKEEQQ